MNPFSIISLDKTQRAYYYGNTIFNINVLYILQDTNFLSGKGAKANMKIKTSITLSEEIIRQIDELSSQYGNRSALIEQAVRDFLDTEAKRRRDFQDSEILNRRSDALNKEAKDVLSYQVAL
jgi:Arc/MetJ-type ribon-helix-helix transcriptional regulator